MVTTNTKISMHSKKHIRDSLNSMGWLAVSPNPVQLLWLGSGAPTAPVPYFGVLPSSIDPVLLRFCSSIPVMFLCFNSGCKTVCKGNAPAARTNCPALFSASVSFLVVSFSLSVDSKTVRMMMKWVLKPLSYNPKQEWPCSCCLLHGWNACTLLSYTIDVLLLCNAL